MDRYEGSKVWLRNQAGSTDESGSSHVEVFSSKVINTVKYYCTLKIRFGWVHRPSTLCDIWVPCSEQ